MTLFGSANIQPINKKWTTYQCPQLSFNPKTGIYLKEISFKSFGVNKILRIIQSGNHPVRKLSNLLPTWFSSLTVRQPIEAPPTFSHQLTSNQLITIHHYLVQFIDSLAKLTNRRHFLHVVINDCFHCLLLAFKYIHSFEVLFLGLILIELY